jgi:hypothetical protein
MKFNIRMGVPEMENFWKELCQKADEQKLGNESKLFKRLVKTLSLLENNPKHPGLKSHEIKLLTKRYGVKVWQSYLENNTPSAGRLFWIYGPGKNEITIIGIEPHPEDKKKDGYRRIKLSDR